MVALLLHLKVLGYVVAGFASARVWFRKEIAAARAAVSMAEGAVVAETKKLEGEAKKIL
jgi:hypothetical protein